MITHKNIHQFILLCAEYFGLTYDDIVMKSRTRNRVKARHFIRLSIHQNTNFSLREIGQVTGGADHTTVLHSFGSCETYKDQVRVKKALQEIADTMPSGGDNVFIQNENNNGPREIKYCENQNFGGIYRMSVS